jgi:cell division control protein 6
LRVAAELCEREGKTKVGEEYIDLANNKIEKDKILDIIETYPKQHKLVLYSIVNLDKEKNNKKLEKYYTGDVYNLYQDLCLQTKTDSLTQRRVSDILADLDMMGIINAKIISKGRHGRTREIKMGVPSNLLNKIEKTIKESIGL